MRIKETFSVTVSRGESWAERERWLLDLCMFSISKYQLAFFEKKDNAKLPTFMVCWCFRFTTHATAMGLGAAMQHRRNFWPPRARRLAALDRGKARKFLAAGEASARRDTYKGHMGGGGCRPCPSPPRSLAPTPL
jgi:hypothetical protein